VASHVSFIGKHTLPTGALGVMNRGILYRVDLKFQDAVKTVGPALVRAGYRQLPEVDAGTMKVVGFEKSTRDGYALESMETDAPGTCSLVHSDIH